MECAGHIMRLEMCVGSFDAGCSRYRKSLNRSLPQIEACLKLTPGVLQNLV